MKPLLEVSNLKINFHPDEPILKGVDFKMSQGEIVGLIGETGSGKSMIAHAILKLLPNNAHILSGEILFNQENLFNKTEKEMQNIRGEKISMIFQDAKASLNPTMQIGNQMSEALRKKKNIPKKLALEKCLELLKQTGLTYPEKRLYQYPHELSGGMCQRVLIAMALACEPTLLIADEPTTALDVSIQKQILEILKDVHRNFNLSILLITHDMKVLRHLCHRALILYDGIIIEENSVEQLFSHPKHPYTQLLIKHAKAHY